MTAEYKRNPVGTLPRDSWEGTYHPKMIEAVAAVAGVIQAASPALSLSRNALRRLRLYGTYDVKWLEIDPGQEWLSAAEVSNLEDFLSQRESRALLSMLATTLLAFESDLRTDAVNNMAKTFENLAIRWDAERPNRWLAHSEAIWAELLQIYSRATPAGQALADAAQEYTDFIAAPLGRQATERSRAGSTSRYIERLSDLCADLSRVTDAIDLAAEIRDAIAETPAQPIITYTSTSKPATFEDLYVSRTLVDDETSEELTGLPLGSEAAPYRAVLQGAPGAGKSTFVRNLRQELAAGDEGQAALLITVRGYLSTASAQTVVEHLRVNVRSVLSLEFDLSTLRDAITLGLVVVVFDGLDEITDINLRLEMVDRITNFAREYPATSVLVTSRSVGYERAPLPTDTFRTLMLDQYNETQSLEYVQRWFGFIERPELIPEFERESQSVLDLKANPLLLSLLCVLYRERGSIPRRRRDIYADCADLLFHTWDSHRHINQPEELHANGDRIMQEIARWVYTSQTAQNGLPESVIQKTIGIYLRDNVGVEEGEARRRAGEFLEFCATRAWLLGTTGTLHGERVFGFTHRTFFEYFTAEAFSRSSGDPKKIAELLLQANSRDATSVLPELLLQAFDQKVERGAADAFRKICELTHDGSLILRLMEGVPLPAKIRAVGFDRILSLWHEKESVPESSFIALLTLNSDARVQFVREYLAEPNDSSSQLFLAAWASLDLASNSARHQPIWGEIVDPLARDTQVDRTRWYSSSLQAWLWRNGYLSQLPAEVPLFVTRGTSGPRVGCLWLGLEMASGGDSHPEGLDALFDQAVLRAKRRKPKVGTYSAIEYAHALQARCEGHSMSEVTPRSEGTSAEFAYFFAVAVLYEALQHDEDALEDLRSSLSPRARNLWESREAAAQSDSGPRGTSSEELAELPPWLREWARGRKAFVGDAGDAYDWGDEFV